MEYNLCDYNTVKRILTSHGFTFSKALGQNFLIDSDVCPAMAEQLNADDKTGVLEIGPGIGVLTKELCRVANKVVAIELDKRLYPVLDETLADCTNFELVCGDVMKLDLAVLIKEKFEGCTKIKICANLPYYITSPVIMLLLESRLPVDEIVVMVQKEAADRLCAQSGSRNSSAITVAVNYYGDAIKLFDVGRESFMPSPKVDSSVIKIVPRTSAPFKPKSEEHFFATVKAAFAQRRKTVVNSICASMPVSKDAVLSALSALNLSPNVRAENLTTEEFVNLSDLLTGYEKK